jgi:hypothetical protein
MPNTLTITPPTKTIQRLAVILPLGRFLSHHTENPVQRKHMGLGLRWKNFGVSFVLKNASHTGEEKKCTNMAVITDFPHIYGVLFKKISSHIS